MESGVYKDGCIYVSGLIQVVYYEKNGQISLKVRFQAGKNAVSRDHEDVHYKRKSTRQVQRDIDRSHAWHKQRLDGTAGQNAPAPVTPGASSSQVAGLPSSTHQNSREAHQLHKFLV